MENNELKQILDRHAYMWFRDGFSLDEGVAIGFNRIEGRKPGQEIVINNFGTVDRQDFRYLLRKDGKTLYENFHFGSPEEALSHSLDWSEKTDPLPTLRRFEWFKGHYAWAVDGYVDLDVIVIESEPGKFLLRTVEEDRLRYDHDPAWKTPMDALTV